MPENEQPGQETPAAVAAVLEPVARWRASAESDGPQGADGTAELARTAWRNLLAAEWEYDHDPASMPVHEYERARPTGQAYKAVWGYDRACRAQRSCCGAACLTYRVPDGALASGSGQDAVGAATIYSVSVQVAVDRYCDAGCVVHAELSDSVRPPPAASVAALALAGTPWLPTSSQTGADGAPLAPNRRSGMSGTATLAFPEGTEARRYLHVYLFMADYLGVRDAWIEGGAMFAAEAATAEFSRAPGDAAAADPAGLCRMDLGALAADGAAGALSVAQALARFPRVRLWANWSVKPQAAALPGLDLADWDARARNLLAYVLGSAGLYASQPDLLDEPSTPGEAETVSAALAKTGRAALSDNPAEVAFCALVCHGLTRRRVFRGIRFAAPVNPAGGAAIPYRALVYGIAGPLAIGSAPASATVVPWWGDAMSEAFRRGAATGLKCLSSPGTASGGYTAEVAATPLAAVDVAGECAEIPFREPWATGEVSTVVVALVPDGVPAASSSATTYNATVSRTVYITAPNSGAAATSSAAIGGWIDLTRDEIDYTCSVSIPASALQAAKVLPVISLSSDGSYYTFDYNTYLPGRSGDEGKWITSAHRAEYSGLTLSFQFQGRTYSGAVQGAFHSPASVEFRTKWLSSEQQFEVNAWIGLDSDLTVPVQSADGHRANVLIQAKTHFIRLYPGGVNGAKIPIADACAAEQAGATLTFSNTHRGWHDTAAATIRAYCGAGTAHTWASASDGEVQAGVSVRGTASFVDGNSRAWTAELPASARSLAVTLKGKTAGGTALPGTGDTTALARVALTLPATAETIVFSGPGGARLTATLSLPAASIDTSITGNWRDGDLWLNARGVARGEAVGSARKDAETVSGAAAVAETGTEQAIDLGDVALYE